MTKRIPTTASAVGVGNYERRKVAHAFGVTLQIMRRQQAVSQDRLSYRCGLDRTYPSLLERGLRQPTLSMLLRIADALGVEPQVLLDGTLAQLRKEMPP